MSKASKKSVPGHKCGGTRLAVQATCECGWRGAHWYGQGARRNAYGEWRQHVDQACKEQQAKEQGR